MNTLRGFFELMEYYRESDREERELLAGIVLDGKPVGEIDDLENTYELLLRLMGYLFDMDQISMSEYRGEPRFTSEELFADFAELRERISDHMVSVYPTELPARS